MDHLKAFKLKFAQIMEQIGSFEPAPFIAVGVSGGSDSLALAYLLHLWCQERGGQVVALSVDHKLRPEAEEEAKWVRQALLSQGIRHEILTWDFSSKPQTGIQEKAREARYRLLEGWCAQHGILHLATAHHLHDQVETFLIRLENKSTLIGLAGMPLVGERPNVRLLRPFLKFTKEDLCTIAETVYKEWVHDPSNLDLNFRRIYWRKKLETSCTPDSLENFIYFSQVCGDIRAEEQEEMAAYWVSYGTLHPMGWATLTLSPLLKLRPSASLYTLGRVLQTVGGGSYPPRGKQLQALWESLKEGVSSQKGGQRRTLSGCVIEKRENTLRIYKEDRHMPAEIPLGEDSFPRLSPFMWDRFQVFFSPSQWESLGGKKGYLAKMGEKSWDSLSKEFKKDLKKENLRLACLTCPVVWCEGIIKMLPDFLRAYLPEDETGYEFFKTFFSPPMPLMEPPFIKS
jgi:tRNA(Ile)-lysidine synthase